MAQHLVKSPMMINGRKSNAAHARPRTRGTHVPTRAEEEALERRINEIVEKHKAKCGEPENWGDAGKAEKLIEQLYRNELLRIQALKDSGALVPLDEVAKRDELTAAAFMWALGEMLEWASERIPAHQRNEVRQAGSVKLAQILSEVSERVAAGMEEVAVADEEVLPPENEGERE